MKLCKLLGYDKGFPKARKHDITGWPCPVCNEPAWTGDRGCNSCGISLAKVWELREKGLIPY